MRFAAIGLVAALVAAAVAEPPKLLHDRYGAYPRLVMLDHSGERNDRIIASVNSTDDGDGIGIFFESVDNGQTFRRISTIREPDGTAGRGQCCGTLFELPRPLGRLHAGTLPWANTTGWEVAPGKRQVKQRLWQSPDGDGPGPSSPTSPSRPTSTTPGNPS